jgi:hypothetical protein
MSDSLTALRKLCERPQTADFDETGLWVREWNAAAPGLFDDEKKTAFDLFKARMGNVFTVASGPAPEIAQ